MKALGTIAVIVGIIAIMTFFDPEAQNTPVAQSSMIPSLPSEEQVLMPGDLWMMRYSPNSFLEPETLFVKILGLQGDQVAYQDTLTLEKYLKDTFDFIRLFEKLE